MFNVYIITNQINGKQYVGLTTKTIQSRLTRHIYDAKREDRNKGSLLLTRAIRKYGKENFKIDLVSNDFLSIQELKRGETAAIKSFNTLAPNGYNLKIEEENNFIYSEELKEKMAKGMQGAKRCGECSFVGVSKHKNKFRAHITYKGQTISLGNWFLSEKDAAISYDLKAIELYGDNAKINFEENRLDYISNEKFANIAVRPKRKTLPKKKVTRIKNRHIGIKKNKDKWTTIYSCKVLKTDLDAAVAYDIETLDLKNGRQLNFPENIKKYESKEIIPNYYRNNTLSKYRGVTFHHNKWLAQVCINRRAKSLGYFLLEEDAAKAYNVAALVLFGDKAKLNIIVPIQ